MLRQEFLVFISRISGDVAVQYTKSAGEGGGGPACTYGKSNIVWDL